MPKEEKEQKKSGWWWVPSLYYAQGIPYIVVMMVSVAMYKMLGVSNAKFAFWTSTLYLPWVIKPIWSPIVEMFSKKRKWIIITQFLIGLLFVGIAFFLQFSWFFTITIAVFWIMAFSSATHDIAADGFYMLGLTEKDQSFFIGIRSTFYRFAMMTGQGLLLILVGYIEIQTGLPAKDVTVFSSPDKKMENRIDVEDFEVEQKEGELEIVTYPDTLKIQTQEVEPEKIDSMRRWAKNWNIEQGHIPEEEREVSSNKNEQKESKEANSLSGFEQFIQETFGEEIEERNVEGNYGLVYLHLSKEPDEDREVGVNFGRDEGNKSITLVHGQHLKFNSENWDKPAVALIKLHPNLKDKTSAIFRSRAGNTELAWTIMFAVMGVVFVGFSIYHKYILPHPPSDKSIDLEEGKNFLNEFMRTFKTFFEKNNIGLFVAFLLLYRLSESQLVKLVQPFMLASQESGGLALTASEVGFAYGTIGIAMLAVGGVLGGILASKYGLKKLLWWMAISINIPNALYIFLAHAQPDSFFIISSCIGIEQFGYGFGFSAYMLTQIYIAEGEHKTAHYAITTGFMALGMMIPGMWSGWLQELIGYEHFFIWALICIIPIFSILPFLYKKIDPSFGVKEEE